MRTPRWLERLLLVAGLIAVNFWLWSIPAIDASQDWSNWAFDREMRGERATVGKYLLEKPASAAEKLLAWWGYPETRGTPTLPARKLAPPAILLNIPEDGLIGRLTIPRLHLSAIIRQGAGEETLRAALGHIPGTPMPGQPGNVGVAGHRDTLFRSLSGVRKDDVIVLETLQGRYVYQVDATKIVKPTDVGVLRSTSKPKLTLVTCYPFYYVGPAPDRFIVSARQVGAGGPELATAY